MRNIYYKSREAINLALESDNENISLTSVNCNCGESIGFTSQERQERHILCESCYNEAPIIERGE